LPVLIGGQSQKETYKDFQKEMDILNQALCEVYVNGDANGRVLLFLFLRTILQKILIGTILLMMVFGR